MSNVSHYTPHFASALSRARFGLTLLLCFHIVACCLSLIYVAEFYSGYQFVWFDKTRLYVAALSVALFAVGSLLFALSRFQLRLYSGILFLHDDPGLSLARRVFAI